MIGMSYRRGFIAYGGVRWKMRPWIVRGLVWLFEIVGVGRSKMAWRWGDESYQLRTLKELAYSMKSSAVETLSMS